MSVSDESILDDPNEMYSAEKQANGNGDAKGEGKRPQLPQLDEQAEDIVAPGCIESKLKMFYLSSCLKKFVLLVFYPCDFPVVGAEELKALSERVEEFREIDCEVVGISTETHFAHLAFVNAPTEKGGYDRQFKFPLVSDKTMNISKAYGMLNEQNGLCYRGSVLIDPHGLIKFVMLHDYDIDRNIGQLLNTVSAFRVLESEEENVMTPEGWQPGSDVIRMPEPLRGSGPRPFSGGSKKGRN